MPTYPFSRCFLVSVPLLMAAAMSLRAGDLPSEASVEWRTEKGDEGQAFDGKTSFVDLGDAHHRYNPADGFTVSVWIRPEGFSQQAGIVEHYDSSKTGCWYLSLSTGEPYRKLRVTAIEEGPKYLAFESNKQLDPGKWYHVILSFDAKALCLLCDGRMVGTTKVEKALMVPPETKIEIGRLNKQHYFQGRIRDLRIYDRAIDISSIALGENHLRNSSFEMGDCLADMVAWHRMTGIEYLVPDDCGWVVVREGSWHGRQCLKADGTRPLLLPAEVWAPLPRSQPWTFSAYVKAEREGVPCELRLGSYRGLEQEYHSERVTLGREWKRYELTVDNLHLDKRRHGSVQGPMNFWIKPLEKATVWVDAVQWELGDKALGYSPSERDRALTAEEFELLGVPEMPASKPVRPNPDQKPGEVPIMVYHRGSQPLDKAPVQLGVPFPAGVWNGQGTLRLTAADGRTVETQTEILSQWHGDGSLQSLGLYFEADVKPSLNEFVLRYDPRGAGTVGGADTSLLTRASETKWHVDLDGIRVELNPKSGTIWDRVVDRSLGRDLLSAAPVHAVGLDGTAFDSLHAREIVVEVEKEGPLHVSIAKRGLLASADGHRLLMFIARLHLWRDVPGVHVEVTLVNSRLRDSVALREVYWTTTMANSVRTIRLPWKSAEIADGLGVLQYYDYAKKDFCRGSISRGKLQEVRSGERGEVWLGWDGEACGYHLQTRLGWQQHPTMLLAEPSGKVKAYIWPGRPVMGVEFSRGMSITRDFTLIQTAEGMSPESSSALAGCYGQPPVAMTAPSWFARADLLLPVYQSDPKRFPFLEGRISSPGMLGPLTPEAVERNKTYGLFDYGDNHGDGGWANLESYADHCIIMLALRNGDPEILGQGFIGARHYRDMDMNQIRGFCITHNPNHVMGGASFSHAWPQGVYSHYLLTGSRRSLEVSLRNGEYMREIPVSSGSLESGNRTLGRFLLNLADIYQVTGDERYLKRFMDQVVHNVELLKKRPEPPDNTIFGRGSDHMVPYHGWYGCMALIKMYRQSGNESLPPHIRREVQASMNMQLYRLDLEQLWPGVSPEKGWPIICADFARHRGNVLYPVLTSYAKITGERKWSDLALRAAYAGAVEGRAARSIQAVLVSAVLAACPGDVSEHKLIEEARDLLWNAASPKLLNGDFSMSRTYWEHWRPFPGKSLAHHESWQRRRPEMVSLDTKTFKVNAPSLRFDMRTAPYYTSSVSIDSARVRIEPGMHRFDGWIRVDAGAGTPYVRLNVSPLDGRYMALIFAVRPDESNPKVSNSTDLEVKSCEAAPPDAEGWRQIRLQFRAPTRCVVTVMFGCSLAKGSDKGHLWLDGLELTKVGD